MHLGGVGLSPVVLLGTSQLHGTNSLVLESASFALGRGESARFSVLHCSSADPVDAGIVADGLVRWVNHNDLEPLVVTVHGNPIGVKNSQRAHNAADTLLSVDTELTVVLETDDTDVTWLTIPDLVLALSNAASSSDTDSEDYKSLLGLVSNPASLLWAGWVADAHDLWELTIFPLSDTRDVDYFLVVQIMLIYSSLNTSYVQMKLHLVILIAARPPSTWPRHHRCGVDTKHPKM